MAAPFFDNISGTVTGGPTTGAFTLTGAATGAEAWSTVPSNQIVNYRADEGSTWERGIGLWNGTTLTRNLVASSTGSLISFGTGVVVALDVPADEVQCHIGGGKWGMVVANATATPAAFGMPIPGLAGTAAGGIIAATNYLTRQIRLQYTSATTADAGAGMGVSAGAGLVSISSSAFMGGFEFVSRFGAASLPTGPRMATGLGPPYFSGEPSAMQNAAMFAKDSTDTNIQFMTNNGTTTTKVDTGIPLVANSYYEAAVWAPPGTLKVFYRLTRLDTGAVKSGSTTTTLPPADTLLLPSAFGAVGTATGTAIVFCISSLYLKSSF